MFYHRKTRCCVNIVRTYISKAKKLLILSVLIKSPGKRLITKEHKVTHTYVFKFAFKWALHFSRLGITFQEQYKVLVMHFVTRATPIDKINGNSHKL